MNQATIEKLKLAAPGIERFRQLHPSEQEWIEPLLDQTVRTALNILDCISNRPLTFDEVAKEVQMHPQSISQILNALSVSGVSIHLSEKGAYAPTGRPRKLARR